VVSAQKQSPLQFVQRFLVLALTQNCQLLYNNKLWGINWFATEGKSRSNDTRIKIQFSVLTAPIKLFYGRNLPRWVIS
jgi:hypothetical protein